ncbi:hypothetical protein SC206_01390 [Rouxiella sp. T17]
MSKDKQLPWPKARRDRKKAVKRQKKARLQGPGQVLFRVNPLFNHMKKSA